MFLFGVAAALLGATLPLLSERLEIGLGRVGTLFLVMNACMLASSFALGALQDRFGMKPPLVVGPLVVGAALLVVAGAETYAHLLLAVALLGVGGSALNGASNALVADLHEDLAAKSAALNRVGLFFGFGALFIPFADRPSAASCRPARESSPRGAALCILVAVANALPAYPAAKQAGGLSLAESARFVRDPFVLLLGLLLFFQSGNEFIVGRLHDDVPDGEIGHERRRRLLRPGRLLGRPHAHAGVAGTRALVSHGRGASCWRAPRTSAVVTALLVTATAPFLAVAMVVVLGAALAGIFPAVLGVAGSRYPAHSGTVFGILFTMALSGGMTLPWVTGQAAAAWGLRKALGLVVLQFLAVVALQWLVTAGRARPATAGGR